MKILKEIYGYFSNDWNKTFNFIFMSILLLFIPVLGWFAILGLYIEVLSRVIKGDKNIPKVFSNFWQKFTEGVKAFVFLILVFIPLFIIIGIMPISPETLFGIIFYFSMGYVAGLFIMAGMANYAGKRKFSEFFNLEKSAALFMSNKKNTLALIIISAAFNLILNWINALSEFNEIANLIVLLLIIPINILFSAKLVGDWYLKNSKTKKKPAKKNNHFLLTITLAGLSNLPLNK